jgi:hypothetical protein
MSKNDDRASQPRAVPPRVSIALGVSCTLLVSTIAVSALTLYFVSVPTRLPLWSWAWFSAVSGQAWSDAAQTAVTALGAVGVFGAAFVAYRKQRSTEVARDDAVERSLHERYVKAANLLGTERAMTRLGGVYAFATLADDWKDLGKNKYRDVALDVLDTYHKSATVPGPDEPGGPRGKLLEETVRGVIEGILNNRGRQTHDSSGSGDQA